MTEHRADRARLAVDFECQIGPERSGERRYAAAMYFYSCGELSAEMLEIYRRCCNDDSEDPQDLARFEGVFDIRISRFLGRSE